MVSAKSIVPVILASLLLTVIAVRAGTPKRMKKTKPINWNHTYYSGKFGLCKKLRMFNPVELVKAQVYVTTIFRKCGPRILADFVLKNNAIIYGEYNQTESSACLSVSFSHFIIEPRLISREQIEGRTHVFDSFPGAETVSQLVCYAINFAYTYFAGDGSLIIPNNVRNSNFFALAGRIYQYFALTNHNFTVKHGKQTVLISSHTMAALISAAMECVFTGEFMEQTDGDVLKQGVDYFKFMLV